MEEAWWRAAVVPGAVGCLGPQAISDPDPSTQPVPQPGAARVRAASPYTDGDQGPRVSFTPSRAPDRGGVHPQVQQQLAARGLLVAPPAAVMQGTLLDATLVAAQVRRPRGGGAGAGSPRDPDAAWARRGPHARFGYKLHLGVDADLIRRAMLTPANVNETEVADGLIAGDEGAVYGDAAYGTHARSTRLRALGIADRLMRRPNKHHPRLGPTARRRHARIEQVRRPVEHVFGTLKRSYGYQRVRYRGLARNTTEMWFGCWPTTCAARTACWPARPPRPRRTAPSPRRGGLWVALGGVATRGRGPAGAPRRCSGRITPGFCKGLTGRGRKRQPGWDGVLFDRRGWWGCGLPAGRGNWGSRAR